MAESRSLLTPMRLIAGIGASLLLFGTTASASTTIPVLFFTNPPSSSVTGSVTYANLGDNTPSSFSFSLTDPGCGGTCGTWTELSTVNTFGSWWSGPHLVALQVEVIDNGLKLVMSANTAFSIDVVNGANLANGTYAIDDPIPPGVPALSTLTIAMVSTLLGVMGYSSLKRGRALDAALARCLRHR